MWKNNRPEGWANPHKGMGTVLDDNCEVIKLEPTTAEHRAYEAGADAMLEGLKKQGKYNTSGYGTTDFPSARKGWFIFIPD